VMTVKNSDDCRHIPTSGRFAAISGIGSPCTRRLQRLE